MDASKFVIAAIVVGSVFFDAVGLQQVYWNASGTGGWGDASRWEPQVVPGSDSQVRISGSNTAYVTDADLSVFTGVGEIVIESPKSVLSVSNDTDFTYSVHTSGWGLMVKNGTGKITVAHRTGTRVLDNSAGVVLNDGSMAYAGPATGTLSPYGPLTVNAPAKFIVSSGNNILFRRLFGDGTIVYPDDYGYYTYFASNVGDEPGDFSGTIEGKMAFYGGDGTPGCNQNFTNPDFVLGGNFWGAGRLGFVAFPATVARANCEWEYLGSGGASDTSYLYLNNETFAWKISGGPNGGLEIKKNINANAKNSTRMMMVEWSGNHATPCVFSGNMRIGNNDDIAIYYKKTGTGTWRFNDGSVRRNKGVVATERGVLEYASIAEQGTTCSLGTASMLHSEYYGLEPDPTKAVPYAYLIGDGTNHLDSGLATMRYVGSAAKSVLRRPVSIKGAGAFESQGAALNWWGFTCAQAGANTLVLGGAASGSVASSVTNGIGTLSLVKEGAGSWALDGDYDLNGSVQANAGSLTLRSAEFKYYKLTLMQNWYDVVKAGDGGTIWLSQFGLFDAGGTNWVENLTYSADAVNNVIALNPGEVSFGTAGITYLSNKDIEWNITNVFNSAESSGAFCRNGKPVLEDQSTWVSLILRPKAGHNPLVKYDLRNRTFGNNQSYREQWTRDVRSWKLQGSVDGVSWTDLHSVISNSNPVTEGMYRWACDHGTSPTGWAIESTEKRLRPQSLASVGAKAGASLVSNEPLTVRGLTIDAAAGSGTLSGFNLAESGTLTVVNAATAIRELNLPIDLSGLGNVSRLTKWSVIINGKECVREVEITSSGIRIMGNPLLLIFR